MMPIKVEIGKIDMNMMNRNEFTSTLSWRYNTITGKDNIVNKVIIKSNRIESPKSDFN